jgi:hypothetical protein
MLQKLNFKLDESNLSESLTMHQEGNLSYALTIPNHPNWSSIQDTQDPMLMFVAEEIEPGVYKTGLNFEHSIEQFTDFKAINTYDNVGPDGRPIVVDYNAPLSEQFKTIGQGINPYGISDNVEQIKAKFKDAMESSNPVVIAYTEIRRDEQPAQGGWRWHKWGEYIGTQDSQCEYIHDEPNIESVFVYHVYCLDPKPTLTLEKDNQTRPKLK